MSNPISTLVFTNPFQTQIAKPLDTSAQSSNSHHVVVNSNTNYLHPINLPVAHLQSNPIKTEASYASPGFTFAPLHFPLLATISVPMIPLQTGNLTTQQNHPNNQVFLPQPKPTPSTTTILPSVNQDLTSSASMSKPVNKCGITKYTNSRVVGGAITQSGMQTNILQLP